MKTILTVMTTLVPALAACICLQACDALNAGNQIRANYDFLDMAFQQGDSATALRFISPQTIEFYDRMLKIALTAPEEKVKALRPSELMVVLSMRSRCSKAELEKMDGRGWAIFATEQGAMYLLGSSADYVPWYLSMAEHRYFIGSGSGSVDNGTLDIRRSTVAVMTDTESTGFSYGARKVDGEWTIDLTEAHPLIDSIVSQVARNTMRVESGVLVENERWSSGNDIDAKIFHPPK